MGSADEEIELAQRQILSDAAALLERLSHSTSDADDWFRNLLYGLLKCTLEDYGSVEKGVAASMPQAALGKRNLSELRITTAHVLKSRTNAEEFRHKLAQDLSMFYDGLVKLQETSHEELDRHLSDLAKTHPAFEIALENHRRRGPQTDHLKAEAEAFREALRNEGVESKHFKRTKEMADEQGSLVAKELDAINTVCSKLLHRTPMSIASATTADSVKELSGVLSNSSVTDLVVIYDSIRQHIDRLGLHPED